MFKITAKCAVTFLSTFFPKRLHELCNKAKQLARKVLLGTVRQLGHKNVINFMTFKFQACEVDVCPEVIARNS